MIVTLLGFMGCSKDTTTETTTDDLIGTWEWVRTTGGVAGINDTPKTLGYTYKVTYTKEGRYLQYDKDNKLVYDYPYSFARNISIIDNLEHNMLVLNSSLDFSFEIRNDSLFLFQEVYDGVNVTFVRK